MTEYTSGMDGCRDHELRFDVKLKDGKPAGVGWGWAMV
jgi:hypothetical protein